MRALKKKNRLAQAILAATYIASVGYPLVAVALPNVGDATFNAAEVAVDAIDSSTLNITAKQGDATVSFGGAGFNLGVSDTVNFLKETGATINQMLVADTTGNLSTIDGTINANDYAVILRNANGFTFDGTTLNTNNLVATTYDVSLAAGEATMTNAGSASITVGSNGISGVGTNTNIALIAKTIDVNGDIVTTGGVDMAAAATVRVSLGGSGAMQVAVDGQLDTASRERVIDIARGVTVAGQNVTIQALVDDPASYAINSQGIIRANGITVGQDGNISLVGNGGVVLARGDIEASQDIEMSGQSVLLGADNITGDNLNVTIGDSGTDVDTGNDGLLLVSLRTNFDLDTMAVTGSQRSNVNLIDGLANYTVSGLNSGTAGFDGIGGVGYDNIGAITFTNVGSLTATNAAGSNTLTILESGSLNQNGVGLLMGSGNDDQIFIDGSAVTVDGGDGNDSFFIGSTASILGSIKGGNDSGDPDNIYFDFPEGDGPTINVDFDNVVVLNYLPPVPPVVTPPEVTLVPTVVTPQPLGTPAPSGSTTVALGLTGDDQGVAMPCGYSSDLDHQNFSQSISLLDDVDCEREELDQIISTLIHFDNDKHDITALSAEKIAAIAEVYNSQSRFSSVRVSAHTDDNASFSYNMTLSELRALSTQHELAANGVDKEDTELFWYGESVPAKSNKTAEGRAYNRRALIELIH